MAEDALMWRDAAAPWDMGLRRGDALRGFTVVHPGWAGLLWCQVVSSGRAAAESCHQHDEQMRAVHDSWGEWTPYNALWVKVNLRLFQHHRGARRGEEGNGENGQHLGDTDAHVPKVCGNSL